MDTLCRTYEDPTVEFRPREDTAMAKALDVANEIIRRSHARGKPVSNLELQKLAYFAHGWYLALSDGQPLIDGEPFEAWRFGPVMPGLYRAFKGYGTEPIPLDHPLSKTPELPDDLGQLIDRILEVYGQYAPYELVGLSHDPDGPWRRIYHDPDAPAKIPDRDITAYFQTKKRAA